MNGGFVPGWRRFNPVEFDGIKMRAGLLDKLKPIEFDGFRTRELSWMNSWLRRDKDASSR